MSARSVYHPERVHRMLLLKAAQRAVSAERDRAARYRWAVERDARRRRRGRPGHMELVTELAELVWERRGEWGG